MFGREKAEQTGGLEDIKHMYGKARGEHEGTEEIRNLFEEDDELG